MFFFNNHTEVIMETQNTSTDLVYDSKFVEEGGYFHTNYEMTYHFYRTFLDNYVPNNEAERQALVFSMNMSLKNLSKNQVSHHNRRHIAIRSFISEYNAQSQIKEKREQTKLLQEQNILLKQLIEKTAPVTKVVKVKKNTSSWLNTLYSFEWRVFLYF